MADVLLLTIILLILNVPIFLAGLSCVGFGVYLVYVFDPLWIISIVLIVPGTILTFISIIGCCSSVGDSECSNRLFIVLTTSSFVTKLIAIVIAYIKRNDLLNLLLNYVRSSSDNSNIKTYKMSQGLCQALGFKSTECESIAANIDEIIYDILQLAFYGIIGLLVVEFFAIVTAFFIRRNLKKDISQYF